MCPRAHVGASLGVALRGRGLPVHVYMPVAHLGHWYPVEFSLIVVTVHPSKHHHAAILLLTVERRGRNMQYACICENLNLGRPRKSFIPDLESLANVFFTSYLIKLTRLQLYNFISLLGSTINIFQTNFSV